MKPEKELINIAEGSTCDKRASKAMQELRKRFDSTYKWCNDCDGLVVKEKDCCQNRKETNDIDVVL